MSEIFHGVYPQFVAFVYDPADGLASVTEKIATLLIQSGVSVPADVAIDENGLLTFSGDPNYYADGQFTANPGDVITYSFSVPVLNSAPVNTVQGPYTALIGPYDPSVPSA